MWVNGMMSINLQNSLAVQDVLNNENCQPVNRIEKGDFLEGEEEAIYIPEKKPGDLLLMNRCWLWVSKGFNWNFNATKFIWQNTA